MQTQLADIKTAIVAWEHNPISSHWFQSSCANTSHALSQRILHDTLTSRGHVSASINSSKVQMWAVPNDMDVPSAMPTVHDIKSGSLTAPIRGSISADIVSEFIANSSAHVVDAKDLATLSMNDSICAIVSHSGEHIVEDSAAGGKFALHSL